MPLSLDHVVIAVADLDAAYADYSKLGFTVIRGGEHANGATHNVLVVFADGAYLELIAFKRSDADNRWSRVFDAAGEGFLDYALLPDDIAAVVAGAQKRGLDIGAPEAGGRLRPDGTRLDWKIARSPQSDVPFLCGDVTPRALRVQEGDVRRHANGITGITALTVVVANLEASHMRNAALLGPSVGSTKRSGIARDASARSVTLRLGTGTSLTLASPTGAGAMADALATRGEGPFSLTFAADREGQFDPALCHGARLFMGRDAN